MYLDSVVLDGDAQQQFSLLHNFTSFYIAIHI